MGADSPKPRRWWRRARLTVLVACAIYLALVAGRVIEPSLATDLLLNAPPTRIEERLRAEEPTLVVLQHGLWRSWGSLWRLERALRAHGYEVLNFSYPSTRGTVEEFASLLGDRLEERLGGRDGSHARLCFVGHSLGGLVIREYLSRPNARRADACVFIGTPHRGAVLARLRSRSWLYTAVMGSGAGLQLHPASGFLAELDVAPCEHTGVIYGARGDTEGWNDDIPGDDDGTVGVAEAQLEGQSDAIALPLGHTRLGFASSTIHQVLSFLHDARFDHESGR